MPHIHTFWLTSEHSQFQKKRCLSQVSQALQTIVLKESLPNNSPIQQQEKTEGLRTSHKNKTDIRVGNQQPPVTHLGTAGCMQDSELGQGATVNTAAVPQGSYRLRLGQL